MCQGGAYWQARNSAIRRPPHRQAWSRSSTATIAPLKSYCMRATISVLRALITTAGKAGVLLGRRRRLRARAVALVDIVDHHCLEFGCDVGAAHGAEFLAVDALRRRRGFAGAGQGDADVGVLGFAGAVDDAAHDRDVERFDAGIARLPARHFVADEVLDAARQF